MEVSNSNVYGQREDLFYPADVLKGEKTKKFWVYFGVASVVVRHFQVAPIRRLGGVVNYFTAPALGIFVATKGACIIAKYAYALALVVLGEKQHALSNVEKNSLKETFRFYSWKILSYAGSGADRISCVLHKVDRVFSFALTKKYCERPFVNPRAIGIRTWDGIREQHVHVSYLSTIEFSRYILVSLIVAVVKIHVPRVLIATALSVWIAPPLTSVFLIGGLLNIVFSALDIASGLDVSEGMKEFRKLKSGVCGSFNFFRDDFWIRSKVLEIKRDQHFVQKFIEPFGHVLALEDIELAKSIFKKLPKANDAVDMGTKEFKLFFAYLESKKKQDCYYNNPCCDFVFLNNLLDGNLKIDNTYFLADWLRLRGGDNDNSFINEYILSLTSFRTYSSISAVHYSQNEKWKMDEDWALATELRNQFEGMAIQNANFFAVINPNPPTEELCDFINKLMFSRKIMKHYQAAVDQKSLPEKSQAITQIKNEIIAFGALHKLDDVNPDNRAEVKNNSISMALSSFAAKELSNDSLISLLIDLENLEAKLTHQVEVI